MYIDYQFLYNVIIIKTKAPSAIGGPGRLWISCLGRLVFLLLHYFSLQIIDFDFDGTWWKLLQNYVVCTKLDI